MTIESYWTDDDPTIPVVVSTTETTANTTPSQSLRVVVDINVESTLWSSSRDIVESTFSVLERTQASAALLEILKPPPFLLTHTRFEVPADERSLMKFKYWLDIYQLLSMRQLICKATYTDDTKKSMQYTYTCAHDECHDSVTLLRVSSHNKNEEIPHQRRISFVHTCTPHCQWGAVPPSSAFKPQGFVMSPALRFTIVAQFLYEQVPDDSVLKNICSKDIAASEGLRLQMNRKLGLNVTKGQWKETLQRVHRFFFSYHFIFARPVDRRDVNELTSWDYWRIYNGFKPTGSLFWFQCKVRERDTTRMRWLKRIWLFTGFPILAVVTLLLGCMGFGGLTVLMVVPVLYAPLLLGSLGSSALSSFIFFGLLLFYACWQRRAKAAERELYGQEGVEVTGHVSDRWVVKSSENADTYRVQLTYFETDGTMCHICLNESPGPNEYAESVPMLFLTDRPCSGIPTHHIQAARTING